MLSRPTPNPLHPASPATPEVYSRPGAWFILTTERVKKSRNALTTGDAEWLGGAIVWGGRLIMRRVLSLVVGVATAFALAVPVLGGAPAGAATPTTVVLSFDGTPATAASPVQPALDAHGMHGTFYVNSDLVGSDSGHLGWNDLTALQADGHEVGGHALDMVN